MAGNQYTRRSPKMTDEQVHALVDYMERHRDFATNKGLIADKDKIWEKLTELLNSKGPAQRDVAGWRKTWKDMKCRLRGRVAEVKSGCRRVGKINRIPAPLSELEKRVCDVVGSEYLHVGDMTFIIQDTNTSDPLASDSNDCEKDSDVDQALAELIAEHQAVVGEEQIIEAELEHQGNHNYSRRGKKRKASDVESSSGNKNPTIIPCTTQPVQQQPAKIPSTRNELLDASEPFEEAIDQVGKMLTSMIRWLHSRDPTSGPKLVKDAITLINKYVSNALDSNSVP